MPHLPLRGRGWQKLQIIPLVAGYPAGKQNGVVLCVLKDVPDSILYVGELGGVVREHLGSTSWT